MKQSPKLLADFSDLTWQTWQTFRMRWRWCNNCLHYDTQTETKVRKEDRTAAGVNGGGEVLDSTTDKNPSPRHQRASMQYNIVERNTQERKKIRRSRICLAEHYCIVACLVSGGKVAEKNMGSWSGQPCSDCSSTFGLVESAHGRIKIANTETLNR